MVNTDKIKTNTTPTIKTTLRIDGLPIDLTDYVVTFKWRKTDVSTKQPDIIAVIDPDQVANKGVCRVNMTLVDTSSDTLLPGEYSYEYVAVNSSTGTTNRFPLTNNNDISDFLSLFVSESL